MSLENGRFRTKNLIKIDPKKIVIRYLGWEAGLGKKNQLNRSFQSVAPSKMIYIRL